MKLVIVSDLHLDTVTDGVHRGPEIMRGVRQAMTVVLDHRGKFGDDVRFMFAGDLCDPYSARSHWAVAQMVAVASELNIRDVSSIWMTGNHDVFDDGSGDHTLMALKGIDELGVTVIDKPIIDLVGDRCVLFLPFTAMSHSYDPDAFVRGLESPPDVVIGHLNLEGITPGSESSEYARGRSVYWPIEALRECCPNAMLIGGHYHERQVFQGVNIIGSMARLTHGESDHVPGFIVVDV